jgi:hypothetical protein
MYDAGNVDGQNNATHDPVQSLFAWKNVASGVNSLGSAADLAPPGDGSLAPTLHKVAQPGVLMNRAAVESDGTKGMASPDISVENQPLTWAWVFRSDISSTQVISAGGSTLTNQLTVDSAGNLSMYAGISANPAGSAAIEANKWQSLIIKIDGASSQGMLNGVLTDSLNFGTNGIDSIRMFWNSPRSAGVGMIGYIAELLVYGAGAPTPAQIAEYFNRKYGINPQG